MMNFAGNLYYCEGVCAASVDPCFGITPPGSDTICPATTGTWHSTVDTSTYDPSNVCFIGAATGGTNCNTYCAALGRNCMQAQDNGKHSAHAIPTTTQVPGSLTDCLCLQLANVASAVTTLARTCPIMAAIKTGAARSADALAQPWTEFRVSTRTATE